MKRSTLQLETIADWDNLLTATWLAAAGKRNRLQVRSFLDALPKNLTLLQQNILTGTVKCGQGRRFEIRDPKRRTITAPCFRERVLHHALMRHVGPVLERTLVDDTFACIRGRGTRAAVRRCQQHIQRFSWFAKMDIRQYFSSISHSILKELLQRRFKNIELLALINRIINAYADGPGCGLPIGTLTSQCFANYYLGGLDRFLLEELVVQGMIRYMDDFIFWADSREEIMTNVKCVVEFLSNERGLVCRDDIEINRSQQGVTVCGYRVFAGTIRLSRTRRRRYLRARAYWESAWQKGIISSQELQRGFDAVNGMTADADARGWLRRCALNSGNKIWYEEV